MQMTAFARRVDKPHRVLEQWVAHIFAHRLPPAGDFWLVFGGAVQTGQPIKIMIVIAGEDFVRSIAVDRQFEALGGYRLGQEPFQEHADAEDRRFIVMRHPA